MHAGVNKSQSDNAAVQPNIALASQNWKTPHGMSGIDATGKVGGGGEFALQVHRWQTPTTMAAKSVGYQRQANGSDMPILSGQAAKWTTPMAADQRGSAGANKAELPNATMNWPTPSARDHKSERGGVATVEHFNRPSGPTLSAFIEHSDSLRQVLSIHDGRELSPTSRTLRRRLNPAFGCWLMGWPTWLTNPAVTNSARSEMESWRCALQQQLSSLCGEADS